MNRYRVIVWGPGAMGCGCLRELIRRPEFEIAGVLAYSAAKNGKDVGELIGHAPIGVKVTTDQAAILAMEADCVIWCGAMPTSLEKAEEMEASILALLESGKNVVTPVAYHYAYSPSHDATYAKRVEAACRKGNSSIHGTGENPGFWFERVALTLTGVCNDVEYIKLEEYADCSGMNGIDVLNAIGFGVPPEQARGFATVLGQIWQRYHFAETLNFVSKSLYGRHLDRIDFEPEYHVADRDYVFAKDSGDPIDFTIKKGQVRAMSYHFRGYLDGQFRLEDSVNWFLTPRTSPFTGKVDSQWDLEIEGKPTSLQCTVRAVASVKDHLEFWPGDPTSPTWYVTIATMIQAIPLVCAAEPGVLLPSVFASSVPDLRMLPMRKSAVG